MPRYRTETTYKQNDPRLIGNKFAIGNKNKGSLGKKIHSAEWIEQLRKRMLGNQFGQGNKGKDLTLETKIKIGLANKNKREGKSWEDIFGREKATELKRIVSERSKKLFRCGIKLTKDGRKRISEKAKERCKNEDYLRKMLTFNGQNKQEELVENLLVGMGYEYKFVGDGQFILGGKCPDFMNVNGQKKLIEFFGTYWHKEKDSQNRIRHFKQYGFDTLVIWDKELKDIPKLKNRIKEFHYARDH